MAAHQVGDRQGEHVPAPDPVAAQARRASVADTGTLVAPLANAVIASQTYAAQKKLAGRGVPDDDQIRSLLTALLGTPGNRFGYAQFADSSATGQAEQRGSADRAGTARPRAGRTRVCAEPGRTGDDPGRHHHPAGRCHRSACPADSQDRVARGAECTRADDLGSASAASVPGSIAHGDYLTAAAQERLTADTAAAHAAGDRSATRLAAESFPCTAADAVTSVATGAIQAAPSAVRANTTVHIRQPGRSA
jgi:hypothetical protein